MAEEEKIREHALSALQALTDKKKGWKEKLKDFFWEMLIIILAVNITLWFHNWSEKRHERELEKNFLIGIRGDLDQVKHDLETNLLYTQPILDYYDSVWVQINGHRIDKAFVDTNSNNLMNTFEFEYNNSRYESFKSSGYLRLIENDSLSLDITTLYTVWLPEQVSLDKTVFNERRQQYVTYIGSKAQMDSSGKIIISDMLNSPDVKFQIKWQSVMLTSKKWRRQFAIQEIGRVINEIDRELKSRFDYKGK